MFRSLLVSVFHWCIVAWGVVGIVQPVQAQKPLIYLQVAKPSGPIMSNLIKDFSPILTSFQEKLQANGYHVITEPDTLRRLLAQSPRPQFLYADVLCNQSSGSQASLFFAVRDTLNKPWFVIREAIRTVWSPERAYSSAAQYAAMRMPTTFTARFGTEAPVDRGPQFTTYDSFYFVSYLEPVLAMAPLRQQLKQGAALELTLHIDELGFATLKAVGNQLKLDAATQQALEVAIRNTPPWGPAYQKGRRTAVDFQTTIERRKPVR